MELGCIEITFIIRSMKTIIFNSIQRKEKELVIKLTLSSMLLVMGCTNVNTRSTANNKKESIKITNESSENDQFGDFDKVHVPNKAHVISNMIKVLKPEIDPSSRIAVASDIQHALRKYKIEPQIVVAIIDTESDFNHDLVSSTGDLSLAQVNVEIWNREFKRMNMDLIKEDKLKADKGYSLEVMAQILHILKTRYEKKDRRWYARYHSKTHKHKRNYLAKLEARMKRLESSKLVAMR